MRKISSTCTKSGTVGLDFGKRKIHIYIRHIDGREPMEGIISRCPDDANRVYQVLSAHSALGYCVAMEKGNDGYAIARSMIRLGIDYHVVEGKSIMRSFRGRKSDREDPKRLAEQLATGTLVFVVFPDKKSEADRDLIRHRDKLQGDLTRQRNRFLSRLMTLNIKTPKGMTPWTNDHRGWLKSIKVGNDTTMFTISSNLNQITAIEGSLSSVDQAISEKTWSPRYHRLTEVFHQRMRHVGPGQVLILATEYHTPGRFTVGNELVAYAGLDLTEHQSGDRQRRRKITRKGSGALRKAACDIAYPYAERGQAAIKPLRASNDPTEAMLYEIELAMVKKADALAQQKKDLDYIVIAVAAEFLRNFLPLLLVCMLPVRSAA